MSVNSTSEEKTAKRKLDPIEEVNDLFPAGKKAKISDEDCNGSVSDINDDELSKTDCKTALEEAHFPRGENVVDERADETTFLKWQNLRNITARNGTLSNPNFHPTEACVDQLREIKVLVIGAGGLGCEILKNLAMMGFANLHVIDMDVVDLSNLNRQFLFRRKDIGRPKAEVAAEFITKRIKGCFVQPYNKKIEDLDGAFYQSFNLILSGLDSVAARQWINEMLLSLLNYDLDSEELDYTTVIPLLDGGTEGFKGNARVILPGISSCIDCAKDLYSPKIRYQLCTLASSPRLPEHCVEYVKLISWPKYNPWGSSAEIDSDNASHISWIYEKSLQRAKDHGIEGITYSLVQGVVKNIIPAVASTNAVIAAACVTEAFKIATNCYQPLSNHLIFNDVDGIYLHSFELERKEECDACRHSLNVIEGKLDITLKNLVTSVNDHTRYEFDNPSITANIDGKSKTLYIPAVPLIEEKMRSNLTKSLKELGFEDGTEFILADNSVSKAFSFRLRTMES
ncbi:hypothetical protein J437_LFUL001478 [Ladona fulva]|uniref:NEDD8-activating enzyme E1 catalytic subunit n=1 Tax=Ladona fulva TaxID=123851 RepID=A0A8K0P1M3_LADFU|nr:hypothetical protein J437_LFUL001478 [Ladona fulva]